MLKDSVTIKVRASFDRNGQDVPAVTGTSFTGRVVDKHRRVQRSDGEWAESERYVWVDGDVPDLQVEDQLELPSGYNPRTPPIQAIRRISTRRGAHHMEIYL
jgi:hypothetical protein